jgi:hypothetical protein
MLTIPHLMVFLAIKTVMMNIDVPSQQLPENSEQPLITGTMPEYLVLNLL